MSSVIGRFSRNQIIWAAGVFLIAIACLVVFLKYRSKKAAEQEFSKYIESYTAGVISKESTIKIKLANQVQTTHAQNEELKSGVFSFSPGVKGKAYWIDAQTIEFRPDEKLDPDKNYEVDFNLGDVTKVSDEFEHFVFDFKTIKPDFSIALNGLQTATATSLDKMKLSGVIQTADNEEPGKIEQLIEPRFGTHVTVTWQHH